LNIIVPVVFGKELDSKEISNKYINGERLPLENVKVKKTPKGLIIGILAAVVIIAIGIVLFILKPWSAGYVATVDSSKITKQEYIVFSKTSMNQFLNNIPNNAKTIDNYDWSTQQNGEAVKEQIKKETLNQIQENKIMLIKAKEAGIKLTTEEIANIDTLEKSMSEGGAKADAEKIIQDAFGVSLAEYKEVYKGFSLAQKYKDTERSTSKITVGDDEVKKYYDTNKTVFDKATVTHIVISTVDSNGAPVSEGKKSEAKKKADDLVAKINAGGDIKALAVENSSDPNAATDKGELTFAKGEMSSQYPVLANLENWAFSNDVGKVGVVEAAYGYDVVKLEKRAESTYDEVKDKIKSALIYTKFTDDFNSKLDAWKKEKQYEIVKNNSVLKKTDLAIYRV